MTILSRLSEADSPIWPPVDFENVPAIGLPTMRHVFSLMRTNNGPFNGPHDKVRGKHPMSCTCARGGAGTSAHVFTQSLRKLASQVPRLQCARGSNLAGGRGRCSHNPGQDCGRLSYRGRTNHAARQSDRVQTMQQDIRGTACGLCVMTAIAPLTSETASFTTGACHYRCPADAIRTGRGCKLHRAASCIIMDVGSSLRTHQPQI